MKQIAQFFAAAVLAVLIAASLPVQAQNNIEQAQFLMQDAVQKFNARDYEAYLETIDDSFKGYTGVYSPFLYNSKAEWSAFILGMRSLASVTYTPRASQFVDLGDNTVISYAYFTFTVVDPSGNTEVSNGRQTAVLVKRDGVWKIAHFHFSSVF